MKKALSFITLIGLTTLTLFTGCGEACLLEDETLCSLSEEDFNADSFGGGGDTVSNDFGIVSSDGDGNFGVNTGNGTVGNFDGTIGCDGGAC